MLTIRVEQFVTDPLVLSSWTWTHSRFYLCCELTHPHIGSFHTDFLPCDAYLIRRNLSLSWHFLMRMLTVETRHKWNTQICTSQGKEDKGLVQITWLKSLQSLFSWLNPSWQQRTTQLLTHSHPDGMWERFIGEKLHKYVGWDKGSLISKAKATHKPIKTRN